MNHEKISSFKIYINQKNFNIFQFFLTTLRLAKKYVKIYLISLSFKLIEVFKLDTEDKHKMFIYYFRD